MNGMFRIEDVSPFQGLVYGYPSTQGGAPSAFGGLRSALGWHVAAPSGRKPRHPFSGRDQHFAAQIIFPA
jgi:hypothetical protein